MSLQLLDMSIVELHAQQACYWIHRIHCIHGNCCWKHEDCCKQTRTPNTNLVNSVVRYEDPEHADSSRSNCARDCGPEHADSSYGLWSVVAGDAAAAAVVAVV